MSNVYKLVSDGSNTYKCAGKVSTSYLQNRVNETYLTTLSELGYTYTPTTEAYVDMDKVDEMVSKLGRGNLDELLKLKAVVEQYQIIEKLILFLDV